MESPFQNLKICRLCWIKCENFEVLRENTKNNMNMLLLKIDLVASEEPVICTNCTERVKKCFAFKSMCLDVHDYTITFVDNNGSAKLDLKDVYLSQKKNNIFIPDDHDICGFCMRLVKGCFAISIDNEDENNILQKLMLEKCVPELDLTIIKRPIICTLCYGSLEDYYQFLTSCLILEEKIKKYCETHNITNNKMGLINVLQLPLSDILMSNDGNTFDIINEGKSFMNQENTYELVDVKSENFMEMEEYQKVARVLFKSEGRLNCQEEDEKGDIIKTEGEFHGEEANQVAQTNVNFVKTEDQKCLLSEEIEIKMDQKDLERIEDEVILPQPEVTTGLRRTRKCLTPSLKEDRSKRTTMYQCDSCSYQTKQKKHLKTHLLVHKGLSEVTMFKCNSCSYQSKLKGNLKTHLLVHKNPSEVTMYKCESCSYHTKYKSHLKMHLLIHKDPCEVSMHKCDYCPYQAKQKSQLNTHLLVHKIPSELTMYGCNSCQYQTKFKYNLKKHLRMHNKNTSAVTLCKYDCR